MEVWGLLKWQSAYLANVKPWVQLPVLKKRRNFKLLLKVNVTNFKAVFTYFSNISLDLITTKIKSLMGWKQNTKHQYIKPLNFNKTR
jgi:hypothetical protein